MHASYSSLSWYYEQYHMSHPVFLGIDAGGTKTTLAVADSTGKIIKTAVINPGNPLNSPLSVIITSITHSAKKELHALSINPEHLKTTCMGMAGLDTKTSFTSLAQELSTLPQESRQLFGQTCLVFNDAYIGFRSVSDSLSGVALIAGTGSNCYGVSTTGEVWSAGDWGYLLGDQFSGFHVGQQLIKLVVAQYDGRQPHTNLTQTLLAHYQLTAVPDLISAVYQTKEPVPFIADAAAILQDQTVAAMPEVHTIIKQATKALAQSYASVIKQLFPSSASTLEVVCIGGLWQNEQFKSLAQSRLQSITPHAKLHTANQPVQGAINLAIAYKPKTMLPNRSVILKSS